jgi:allantoinase
MSARPAALVELDGRKGGIAVGRDADLVVWDPDDQFIVDATMLQHRHKLTPYEGMRLRGVVRETWLRGERVFDRGHFAPEPRGELLSGAAA